MAITLTALNAGIITFDAAAAMVIGANVGTTVTVLLGAIGAVQVKRRVAYSHFIFNLITGVIALALMPFLTYLVLDIFNLKDNAVVGLALFHTLFNVIGVLVFFPFIHLFAKLLIRLVPDRKTELTLFINKTTPDVAEAGISATQQETLHLVRNVMRHNLNILNIDEDLVFSDSNGQRRTPRGLSDDDQYDNLKQLQAEILTFSANIQSGELTQEESEELNRYLHAARMALHSAKTLKDIKHDFIEFENADNDFLNDQFIHFRKRLIESYFKIQAIIEDSEKKDKTKAMLKTLRQLTLQDREFVSLATQAIKTKRLADLNLSTAIIVNRAFVQSSRQILLALRELLLTPEEISQFETVEEISEELVENDS
jgi:phosphate:Na+ symporter